VSPEADAKPDPVPVALLTGFLGSGKTTLLNRLLAAPDFAGTALIVNEFGEIGIDHLLLTAPEEQIVLLDNGCLCCALRDDLATTIAELLRRRDTAPSAPFRQIIVETTGLAEPAALLQELAGQAESGGYALDGVLTLVDATNGLATLDRHPEAVGQAAIADRLVISKSDIAVPEATATLRRRLGAINPEAPIQLASEIALERGLVFGAGACDPGDSWLEAARHHHHDDHIASFAIVLDKPIGWTAFKLWMGTLAAVCGDRLLRVKGFLGPAEAPDRPYVIQGVQGIFHPPVQLPAWPSEDRRTRLVFITDGLSEALIRQTMAVWDDF
jgi:G3E family GTPase